MREEEGRRQVGKSEIACSLGVVSGFGDSAIFSTISRLSVVADLAPSFTAVPATAADALHAASSSSACLA